MERVQWWYETQAKAKAKCIAEELKRTGGRRYVPPSWTLCTSFGARRMVATAFYLHDAGLKPDTECNYWRLA